MSDSLQWVFDLVDKVSTPAGAMAEKVGAAEKALLAASAAMIKTTEALDHNGAAAEHAGKSHEGFMSRLHDGIEMVKWFGEALSKVWEKASEIGHAILSGMAFKQNSLIALEAMAGTRDEAIQIFEGVEDFAWQTGQGVRDVMGQTKDLMSAGFKPEQISVLREMLADLRVVGKTGAADTVAEVLGNMGRVGHLTARHVMALNNAGISSGAIFRNLSEATGESTAALKKHLAQGVIPADKALLSLVKAEMQTYKIDAVGGLAARAQKTLPALIDKVKGIPERIWDALVGYEGGNGNSPFAHILGNIAEAFDPSGPMGQHVVSRIKGLVDEIGAAFGLAGGAGGGLWDQLAGPHGAQKVLEIFDRVADAISNVIRKIREMYVEMDTGLDRVNRIAESGADLAWRLNPGNWGKGSREEYTQQMHELVLGASAPKLVPLGGDEKRGPTAINAPVTVHIHGNADKDHVREGVAAGLADAVEQLGMQTGN